MSIRILSVIGTRPEAIKMAPIVRLLAERSRTFQSLVCVTAQHRAMLDQMLRSFGIVPDIDLNLMEDKQGLAELSARVVVAMTGVIEKTAPDVVLVQGDTTTTMATALAAFYLKVPVGHIEAGLRTGHPYAPFPEEMNRRVITTLATLHFAPTERAAAALRAEQVPADRIFMTGNPVVDALRLVAARAPD
jgi:UDP-N-acetylglucosamine 2-epimerase (non-hydrolysing)